MNIRSNPVPGWMVVGATVIAASLLVLVPVMLPAMIGRSGEVWTLFNSANYRAGDMYYYASMMQQVLHGHVPPSPPNSIGSSGSPEYFRWMTYVVASVPGFLGASTRFVHVFALLFPVGALIALGMLFTREFAKTWWPAIGAAFVSTFYLPVWSALTPFPGGGSFSDLKTWLWQLWSSGISSYRSIADIYEIDSFEVYRFLVPSIGYALLACFALLLVVLDRRPTRKLAALISVFAFLMTFVYPPHAAAAFALLVSYAALNLFTRSWVGFRLVLCTGVATLAMLVLARVPQMAVAGFGDDTFISAVYSLGTFQIQKASAVATFVKLLCNKYVLSFVGILFLSRNDRHLFRTTIAIGGVVVVFSVTSLFGSSTASRFLQRGVDQLWLLLVSAALFVSFAKLIEMRTPRARSVATTAIAVVLLVAPTLGFAKLLRFNATDARHFVADGQWNAYQWLRSNASGEVVAALNWDDIEFISVYSGGLKSVFGPADLANMRPEIAVSRFVQTWKELGLGRDQLKSLLTASADAEYRRLTAYHSRSSTPFLDQKSFASSRIVSALVYYPYIPSFAGGPVAEQLPDGWRTSPVFIDNVLRMFDHAPASGFLAGEGVRFVLLSAFELELLGGLESEGLRHYSLVYETDARIILKR